MIGRDSLVRKGFRLWVARWPPRVSRDGADELELAAGRIGEARRPEGAHDSGAESSRQIAYPRVVVVVPAVSAAGALFYGI